MTARLMLRKVASRRYRVVCCLNKTVPMQTMVIAGLLVISSPRPYRKGVIINPTKAVKQLISERAKEHHHA